LIPKLIYSRFQPTLDLNPLPFLIRPQSQSAPILNPPSISIPVLVLPSSPRAYLVEVVRKEALLDDRGIALVEWTAAGRRDDAAGDELAQVGVLVTRGLGRVWECYRVIAPGELLVVLVLEEVVLQELLPSNPDPTEAVAARIVAAVEAVRPWLAVLRSVAA
jgi:hypothetical protein